MAYLSQNIFQNSLFWGFGGRAYLPITAFDVDFDYINYGKVRLNIHKIIPGDLIFQEGDGKATVRNTGNTRLDVRIVQDDMGLGQTNSGWNALYGGRAGSDALFASYYPDQLRKLSDSLNLSEAGGMDFSIDVSKFPNDLKDNYTGEMTLSAGAAPHLVCE